VIRRRGLRAGISLIELLVVLVILAIAASVTGLALPVPSLDVSSSDARGRIAAARREAITSGRAVQILVPLDPAAAEPARTTSGTVERQIVAVTALPDGSVLAPPALGIARLTGKASPIGPVP
jgi:prepilin-type N-terminal cleavage/methylation domain-containing protein